MSVIRQLAAMFASMDWDEKLYTIIKSRIVNKTASDGVTYECYSLSGYSSSGTPWIFDQSKISFVADVRLKAGKTYKIGGRFIKYTNDTTTANRTLVSYLDVNGENSIKKSTWQDDRTHLFFNWSGGTSTHKPVSGYVQITPTVDIIKIGIGCYNGYGTTSYMLKDSFYIEEVEA